MSVTHAWRTAGLLTGRAMQRIEDRDELPLMTCAAVDEPPATATIIIQGLRHLSPGPGESRMVEPPLTRASLLVRIRDVRDQDAWQQFVRLYAPVVYGFA